MLLPFTRVMDARWLEWHRGPRQTIIRCAFKGLYVLNLNLAPEGLYTDAWLSTPSFWLGVILFFIGMGINLHSDSVIRHLRKPGDTRHYLPQKGMYRYVTSGNYFGELVEWIGFAVLTCSPAAWVFVLWTFANLAPRANSIRNRYREEFGKDAVGKKKRMIPFIY